MGLGASTCWCLCGDRGQSRCVDARNAQWYIQEGSSSLKHGRHLTATVDGEWRTVTHCRHSFSVIASVQGPMKLPLCSGEVTGVGVGGWDCHSPPLRTALSSLKLTFPMRCAVCGMRYSVRWVSSTAFTFAL